MTHVLFLAAIVFLAYVVETAAGFGSAVVALALGTWLFPVEALIAVLMPVNLLLSTSLVVRGWDAIDWKVLFSRIVPLMLFGFAVAAPLAHYAKDAVLLPVFAVFVVGVGTLELWRFHRNLAPTPLPGPVGALLLVLGGFVHGVYATGGPMVVGYASRALPEKRVFRSTLAMLWLLMNLAVEARLLVDGKLTAESFRLSGLMLVPLGLGMAAGELTHHKLDARRFRLAVGILLVASGAAQLWNWSRS